MVCASELLEDQRTNVFQQLKDFATHSGEPTNLLAKKTSRNAAILLSL